VQVIKILLVEVESIIAMDLARRLRALGYEVMDVVSSGEEAVEKARKNQPDVVLMDIRLSGPMDGVQAAKAIRSEADVPVIYVTSYADTATIQRAKEAEPYGYIIKPFEKRNLLTSIELALYKHRMEKKLGEKQLALEISEMNLKRFSREILSIREEEKKKLSRDLHDELGTMVVALTSGLSLAEEDINKGKVQHGLKMLRKTKAQLRDFVKKLKTIAIDLRPPDLDVLGLPTVLNTYFAKITEQAKLDITFEMDIDEKKIGEDIATVLYRVSQEAFTNIVKYANAGKVKVRLFMDNGEIKFIISDDGKGFKTDKMNVKEARLNIGLLGMQERVESLGGKFELLTKPGQGTTISIVLPLKI